MRDEGRELLAAADRLIAEAVALVLEPLTFDETMSGPELLELATEIAQLMPVSAEVSAVALGEELHLAVKRVASEAESVHDLRAAGARAGLNLSVADARSCLRLLHKGGAAWRLRALDSMPDGALAQRRVDLTSENARVHRIWSERLQAANALSCARPSLFELDLDQQISDLRDQGRLFGLMRGTSERARKRVEPHLTGPSARAPAFEMARVLEDVQAAQGRLHKIDEAWEALPAWVRWLADGDRRARKTRLRALDWLLALRDQGGLTDSALHLIRDDQSRMFLASPVAQRVRARSDERTVELGGPNNDVAVRLANGLAIPDSDPPGAAAAWRDQMNGSSLVLARAVLAVRASGTDLTVRRALDGVLEARPSFGGGADPGRPRLRTVFERVAVEVRASQVSLPEVSHPAIADVLRDVGNLQRELAQLAMPHLLRRGPLRVVIAGRTKAGKTTLRKVLTRDPDPSGVGRGAHRTTRHAEAFAWHGIEFVDTPGIAAYDDDFDAETALAACRDADSVLWLYAETLRQEELEHLCELFELGKPVLVVNNAKWKVSTPERLDLFARNPQLAFRHAHGHSERVAQVARMASVVPPQVLTAHVGAAFEALWLPGGALRDKVLHVSRLSAVEKALHELLVLRAQPLRAAELAGSVRRPVAVAAQLLGDALQALPPHVAAAREAITVERRDLAHATDVAEREAVSILNKGLSQLRAGAEDFITMAANASDVQECWTNFVHQVDHSLPVTTFMDRLNRESMRAGVLLEGEARLRDRVDSEGPVARSPRRSRWRMARKAVVGAVRRMLAGFVGRGGAKISGRAVSGATRKVPWLGWVLIALDGVAGAATVLNQEAEQSKIDESLWRRNSAKAVRTELDRLSTVQRRHLVAAVSQARVTINSSLDEALNAADQVEQQFHAYTALQVGLRSAIEDVDLVLAQRLGSLCGVQGDGITRARRTVGSTFEIWASPGSCTATDTLREMIRACLREDAIVHTEGIVSVVT